MSNEVLLIAHDTKSGECIGVKETKDKAIRRVASAVTNRKDFTKDSVKYYFQKDIKPWISINPNDIEEVDEETLLKIKSHLK